MAARKRQEIAADLWPSVTEILRPFFDATYGELEDTGKGVACPWCGGWVGGNEYTKRGHYVGDLMDALVQGQELHPDAVAWFERHETWIPYLEAGKKYLRENPPAEKPICQLRLFDALQRVRGKPDWIWLGRGLITDVKTGASQPPDWLGMQTGAYAVLADIRFSRVFGFKREILWLKDSGEYQMIPHENPHDELDFQALLHAYWVKQVRLGRARLP